MSDESETGVSITFKAGTGFDVPWIVLHGADVAHVREMLLELANSDLTEGVAKVARNFHATYAGANPAGGHGASSSGTALSAPAQHVTATPPPAFVPDQQAQPASWGTPQAVQQLQNELGAQVMGQVPNSIAYCQAHGNAPRQYFPAGTSRTTNKPYGESYRCQVQGCKPIWKDQRTNQWPAG